MLPDVIERTSQIRWDDKPADASLRWGWMRSGYRFRLLKVLTPGAETVGAVGVDAGLAVTTFAAGVSDMDPTGLADNGFGVGFLSSGVTAGLAVT